MLHLNHSLMFIHSIQTMGVFACIGASIAMPTLKVKAICDSEAMVDLTALFAILASVFVVVWSVS